MKLTSADKRQNKIDIHVAINKCQTLSEAEQLKDFMKEAVVYEQIFKCDYFILLRLLENRIRYLTENGCV